MPNWVYNHVTITGTEEAIANVKEFLGKKNFMTGDEEIQFNFANLVSIPEDKLEEYNTIHGFQDGEQVGHTEFNWYEWNCANWGCKWNASDITENTFPDSIEYWFTTPWSVPEPVIDALAKYAKGKRIAFEWYAEEEQGWGVEYEFNGHNLILVNDWDIPNSHGDYKALGRDCVCEFDDELRYDDCPKENE